MSIPLTINPFGIDKRQSQGFQFEIEIVDNKTYTLNTAKPSSRTVRLSASFSYSNFLGSDSDFNNFTPDIDMIVDWGDGQRSQVNGLFEQTKNSHTYLSIGKYIITITGKCNCLDFTNDTFITKVISFGDISFGYLKFYNAINLKEIQGHFNTINIGSELFCTDAMFAKCTSLATINPMLFNDLVACGVWRVFKDCTSLTYTPSKLFYNCRITSLVGIFDGCNSIAYITPDTFNGIIDLIDFDDVFKDCSNITDIPESLFNDHKKLSKISFAFNGTGVTSIPVNLFKNNLELTKLRYVFMSTPITSIPVNLLVNNKLLIDVTGLFSSTKITAISEDLFKYNTKIEKFDQTFSGTTIESIPKNIFYYNVAAKSFVSTFSHTDLKSIDYNIFYNNHMAEDFTATFSMCSVLEYMPSDLFKGVKGKKFFLTFWNCKYLLRTYAKVWDMFSMPKYYGFSYPTSDYYSTYGGCKSLKDRDSIPTNFK